MNMPTSIKSEPSSKSSKSESDDKDFEHYLAKIYKKNKYPVTIIVHKEYQNRDQRIREDTTKQKSVVQSEDTESIQDKESSYLFLPRRLEITIKYDAKNLLSEIVISQQGYIPSLAIQLLALTLPNFQQLTKFTIKNCCIDMHVICELSDLVSCTTISDISLDDCPVKDENYETLLINTSLKSLSLSRCKINDAACERIATQLHFLKSAEKNLVTLNLNSNCIGDEGAKYFADALKSNRHLRYLNLSNNYIGDEGASLLLSYLKEFPLTPDENLDRKRRYLAYLQKKNGIYMECLQKLDTPQKSPVGSIHSSAFKTSNDKVKILLARPSPKRSQESVNKKGSLKCVRQNEDNASIETEFSASELIGPFCPSNMKIKDGTPYCIGNFALCYINLAYNDLTYASLKTLVSVVEYQCIQCPPSEWGLMRVILDGNRLPVDCTELMTIQKTLNKRIVCLQKKFRDKSLKRDQKPTK